MYCSTKELWNIASTRGLTNVSQSSGKPWDKHFAYWKFSQAESSAPGSVTNISFDFWSGYKDYSVTWKYDSSSKTYQRYNGYPEPPPAGLASGSNTGETGNSKGQLKHIDFIDGQTITTKNLLVQFVPEIKSVDVHGHNLYKVIGTGKGILYQNGDKQDITWSKTSRTARTIYKTTSGKEVEFVPGNIWIELLPFGNQISYEAIPQS
jgi:hypothetical protein